MAMISDYLRVILNLCAPNFFKCNIFLLLHALQSDCSFFPTQESPHLQFGPQAHLSPSGTSGPHLQPENKSDMFSVISGGSRNCGGAF